jgi:hypothetical protein
MSAIALALATSLAAAPAGPAPRHDVVDKGIAFTLPKGWALSTRLEDEPGEEEDVIYVARHEGVELHVEVERGQMACTAEHFPVAPTAGTNARGRATCEVETTAPPDLSRPEPRFAATLLVQYPGRHLNVMAFAPTAAAAREAVRAVAATAREVKGT